MTAPTMKIYLIVPWYPVAHPLEGVRVFQFGGKVVGYLRKKPSGVKGLSYRACPQSDSRESAATHLRFASKLCKYYLVPKLKPQPKRRSGCPSTLPSLRVIDVP